MEFYKTAQNNIWLQRIVILVVITFVYWDGLWGGVPRSDQIAYLHQVGGFQNYWDIILNTLSWNRTQAAGDSILFRPLLYIQLGTFYYIFNYNFIYWQIASLILHIIVVLGIHALFRFGSLRSTLYPLFLSILFGVSFLGSELVLWNHISGYILFSVFLVYSVFFLVLFFDSKQEKYAWLSLFLACLSQFTYELGIIFNFFILFLFVYKHYFYDSSSNYNNIKWLMLFSSSILLYPLLNYMDLMINGYQDVFSNQYEFSIISILLAINYSLYQIIYWFGGVLFPAFYDVQYNYGRAVFHGLDYQSILSFVNIAALFFILLNFIGIRRSTKGCFKGTDTYKIVCFGFFFLFSYSSIIAFGRSLPRGLFYTISINIYYSYIACLILIVVVAFIFIKRKSKIIEKGIKTNNKFINFNLVMYFCLSLLCVLNAYEVTRLSKVYRFDYSLPRQELINILSEWMVMRGKEKTVYYSIGNGCQEKGNDYLPWFDDKQIRKGQEWSTDVTLIDALFPEKSSRLNNKKLQNKNVIIDEIRCS